MPQLQMQTIHRQLLKMLIIHVFSSGFPQTPILAMDMQLYSYQVCDFISELVSIGPGLVLRAIFVIHISDGYLFMCRISI